MSSTIVYSEAQLRQTEIYKLFTLGNSYTTKELSEIFKVTQKTIQNDIKLLHMLEKSGRYYSMPQAYRNRHILETAEMSASLMSAMFKQTLPQLSEHVDHLFAQAPKNADVFRFDILLEKIHDDVMLSNIIVAITTKVDIECMYTNAQEQISSKTLYPLKIVNSYGNWYLIAYDLSQEKIKTYHLEHITNLSINKDSHLYLKDKQDLEAKANKIHSIWFDGDEKQVQLKVRGLARGYLKRKEDETLILQKEGEVSDLYEMRYFHVNEVMGLLKNWLPFISIVGDEVLQQQFKEILQEALENN